MINGKRWPVWVAIILFIVTIVLAVLLTLWHSAQQKEYSATVSLLFAPTSATASLNGNPIVAGDTKVKPGNYTIIINKPGFSSSTTSFSLSGTQTKSLTIALTSNSTDTADWYTTHDADAAILDKVGAQGAAAAQAIMQSSFTIADILPISNFDYTITYSASPDKQNQYAVFITEYTANAKDEALQQIQSLGYDPSKYEIIYIDKSS